METKKVYAEETNENVITLDSEVFSSQWKKFLKELSSYLSRQDNTISMVLPIPDRKETLLLCQDHAYHYKNQTLTTLTKSVQEERFLDYTCLSHALKRLNCFGKRLFPIISSTTCLFPFGASVQHAAWLNPAEIEEIVTAGSYTQIRMLNGITYCTSTSKRTIEDHAVNALAILAAYRYDRLHKEQAGWIPLDYLSLPDTPFTRSICQKPLLQAFALPLGTLEQYYDSERFMKNVVNVGKVLQSGVLSYDSFSKLLK